MPERDRDVQRLLTWALIFVLLLALAELLWMAMGRIAQDGQIEQAGRTAPPVRRAPADEEASEMAEATFGRTTVAKKVADFGAQEAFGTSWVLGGSGNPTGCWKTLDVDSDGGTAPWPEAFDPIWQHPVGASSAFSIYCTYDDETLAPISVSAYLDMDSGAPAQWLRMGIYTVGGNYVAGSGWVWLPGAMSGTGWLTLAVSGAALNDGTEYTIWMSSETNAMERLGLAYDLAPVSFSEKILVRDVLRLAVRFNETIPVSDSLRVGVSFREVIPVEESLRLGLRFSETIPISEELKARLKPSPKTGFCFGHHVSEEDAGGRFD